ncbi:hypothetical protein NS220_06435 [Microbacterium testaceum]|uniref:Septum formation-related domain-containing protein n=1 Tax=Microbacterium testaceum TaxID=2033 RepID=A0A147EYJ8_MICTE|nr:DUF4190 domain-containing protein [Microbacterium testaceum]KTR95311.1 hypothetical protein NS220_06435 [Microbacterium testaceum]
MPEPILLHLTLPAGPARDAVASALVEQGFTVQPTATGSLDVSRGSLGTTLIAGAFAGQDMHVRFDVHVTDGPEGAVVEFVHSAAGGFFKGGAVGAVKAGDVVREAAHRTGVRLAEQGLVQGAVPVPPAPEGVPAPADAPGAEGAAPAAPPYTGSPYGEAQPGGVPAYAASASIPPPVDYANRTNVVSIFALVLGFLVPIGGIIAGVVGLSQVKRTGEKGRGLAIAGIIVGSVMTLLTIVGVILFFVFVALGAAEEAQSTDDGGFFDPNQNAPTEFLSLQVGQCLDDVSSGFITSDNLVDCGLPHTYEVFGGFTVPDGAFPGDDAITASAQEQCDAAFQSYIGVSYADSTLEYNYIGPSSETWAQGDREISCLVTDPAGETTGSLQGSAR